MTTAIKAEAHAQVTTILQGLEALATLPWTRPGKGEAEKVAHIAACMAGDLLDVDNVDGAAAWVAASKALKLGHAIPGETAREAIEAYAELIAGYNTAEMNASEP